MRSALARYRFELSALAVALVAALFHLRSNQASPVSLDAAPDVRAVSRLEGLATDLKFRLRGARPLHPDVVVAAIDERGAQKYGLWPWNRAVLAEGLWRLADLGARAIALDITFVDPAPDAFAELRPALARADAAGPPPEGAWTQLRAALASRLSDSPDQALAVALREVGPRLVQGVIPWDAAGANDFSEARRAEQRAAVEPHLIRRFPGRVPGSWFELPLERLEGFSVAMVQTPLPELAGAGGRLGHLEAIVDADGTVRRHAPLLKLTDARGMLPSLAVQAAAAYLGAEVVPRFDNQLGRLTGVALRGPGEVVEIPFQNSEPYAPILYAGPAGAVPTVSLRDAVEGTLEAAKVKGKVVLVGVTLLGSSGDQRVTPFSTFEPGVYTHAAFVSNILSRDFLTRPDGLVLGEVAAMLALALLLARFVPRFSRFRLKAALIAGVALCWAAVDLSLFSRGVQLATVVPLLGTLAVSFALVFLGYASENQEKRALKKTFARYLGADVLEEALLHPEKLDRGEKRELTVLFSDIRGFTAISEAMSPDRLAAFINAYLSPMTRIVFEEKGTLDKYIGDAVMAFWNAPLEQQDHALRACRAAMAMLRKLEALKATWREQGLPEFEIGVGINTGPVIVGNMGSDVRVDYTVMGDAVNLAARLEGTNKLYDTRVILGEGTWAQVQGEVTARRLGAVRVKGKKQPAQIYELRALGPPGEADARAIADFEAGLAARQQGAWAEARAAFLRVLLTWPEDPPAQRYLAELEALEKNPPPLGWDGVYTPGTK